MPAGLRCMRALPAGGCSLIPEMDYELDTIAEYVLDRSHKGKRFSIITVAGPTQAANRSWPSSQGQSRPDSSGRYQFSSIQTVGRTDRSVVGR